MSVGREQAERIAHLARLRFEDEELGRVTEELNRILEHVESLAALQASGGEGAYDRSSGHLATSGAPTVAECSPTRDATAEEPDGLRRAVGAFAPDWREGFFAVPPLPGVHEAPSGSDGPGRSARSSGDGA
jgi:Asp-tRNA(Asn)/Glu-tRNA(Gln) amidotransferase C subunit